jgi:hypothetical protein
MKNIYEIKKNFLMKFKFSEKLNYLIMKSFVI